MIGVSGYRTRNECWRLSLSEFSRSDVWPIWSIRRLPKVFWIKFMVCTFFTLFGDMLNHFSESYTSFHPIEFSSIWTVQQFNGGIIMSTSSLSPSLQVLIWFHGHWMYPSLIRTLLQVKGHLACHPPKGRYAASNNVVIYIHINHTLSILTTSG